ncbi:hypothetical protein [Methanosarcina barkeri]|nr:hypothetical protein [Methanosarcina barkeri]
MEKSKNKWKKVKITGKSGKKYKEVKISENKWKKAEESIKGQI